MENSSQLRYVNTTPPAAGFRPARTLTAAICGAVLALCATAGAVGIGVAMNLFPAQKQAAPAAIDIDPKLPVAATPVGTEFDLDGCRVQAFVLASNGRQLPGSTFTRVKCASEPPRAAPHEVPARAAPEAPADPEDEEVLAGDDIAAHAARINLIDAEMADLEMRQQRLQAHLDQIQGKQRRPGQIWKPVPAAADATKAPVPQAVRQP